MERLKNLIIAPLRFLQVVLEGIIALLKLLGIAASALSGQGTLKQRLAIKFSAMSSQRAVFSLLRAFAPNLSLSKVLLKAYDNNGSVVVTKREDVLDVLSRDADFEVVYKPRMLKLTDSENFFLGMQPGWDYQRDVSAMRLAARQSDVAEIILPRATEVAAQAVIESKGQLDVPTLTRHVPWDMTATYFGVGGPTAKDMQDWTAILFWYLFADFNADPKLDAQAMDYAAKLRTYLDEAIAERKNNPVDTDDVLNRCLALQHADTPGMSDLGIRNNLLGLLIGAIPTISTACCLALDELLRRPDALQEAQSAAQSDNDDVMAQYIWEALRFNPFSPIVYRRAVKDTIIAPSTLRSVTVKQGQMVYAATFSAMFDSLSIPSANEFRTDRPWETYIHWGYGLHTCFGSIINRAIIPAILKPVLQQKNLRRANGDKGQIDKQGTFFPQHFYVEFDPR